MAIELFKCNKNDIIDVGLSCRDGQINSKQCNKIDYLKVIVKKIN